jgi:MFS family permease
VLLNFHLPHYFSKSVRKEIGELYAHSAIGNLALSIVMLFEPIYLWSVLNFTVIQILLFMAVTYSVYIVFIAWGGKLASIYGYKHAIAMSIPFQVLYWMMLLVAKDNTSLAFVAAIVFGLQKSLYWPAFHSLMARYADQGQVGREFGVVYALISISHILGPFIGGFLSQKFGMTATFITASVIYCCSLFPLFTAKEIFIPKPYRFRDTWQLYKDYPKKFLGYLGFGEELLVLTIWPIFIYIIVSNYQETGMLATIASFVAALLAIIVGKITDQYGKRILIKLGAFMTALVWFIRPIASGIWNTLTVDTMSRSSKEICFIPISTVTYIRAENTHVVPYVVFFEQSLAIGKLLACFLGMILFAIFGAMSLHAGFVVLFMLGGLFSLLYMFI